MLSSPGCSGAGFDAWIFSADASSLAQTLPQIPSFGMDTARAVRASWPIPNGPVGSGPLPVTDLGASADAAFCFGLFGPEGPCSVGVLDEVSAYTSNPIGAVNPVFPLNVPAGDRVFLGVIGRNVGIHTDMGGQLFARCVDELDGSVLSTIFFPPLAENSEILRWTSFLMPPRDLHLRLELGHVGFIATDALRIDDATKWEIRVQ
jgi:hypothetical protein